MHNIEDILKHRQDGLFIRDIATLLGLKVSTVNDYLQRAKRANIRFPLPDDLSDQELQDRLLSRTESSRPMPDWRKVKAAMRGKEMALHLAHEAPDGYQHTQFCKLTTASASPSRSPCGKHIPPARSSSLTSLDKPWRSSTGPS